MNQAMRKTKSTTRTETYKPTHLAKADLHNHLSTGSNISGGNLFKKTIIKANEMLGPNGIIGLVNFEDQRYETFCSLPGYPREGFENAMLVRAPMEGYSAVPDHVLIVRGQEIPTKQGHLLVLGLNKHNNIESGKSLEYTITKSRLAGGIIMADHPFHRDGIGPYLLSLDEEKRTNVLNQFDAIEVHNGEAELWLPGYTEANKKSLEFYSNLPTEHEIGAVSTSDGHTLSEIGRCCTYLELEKPITELENADDVRNTLRKSIRKSDAGMGLKMKSGAAYALWHAAVLFGYHAPMDRFVRNKK